MVETHRQLIEKAQAGDAEALAEIVEEYEGLNWKLANKFKNKFDDFEESKAISTMYLIEGIMTYDLQLARPVVLYLYECIQNGLKKESRAKERQEWSNKVRTVEDIACREYLDEVHDPRIIAPDLVYVLKEETTLLLEALHALPPKERHVLTLRYYQGWSTQEIAAHLGIHANTVRRWQKSGKDKILHHLETCPVQGLSHDVWQTLDVSNGRIYQRKRKNYS